MEMNVSAGQNQQHVSRTVARLVDREPYDRSLPVFLFERFEGKGLGVDDQRLRVSSGTLRIRHGEDYEWNPGILQTRGKPVSGSSVRASAEPLLRLGFGSEARAAYYVRNVPDHS